MGTRHSQLGPKLARLDAAINEEGRIDCVIVGSSIVDNGFDPQAFAEGFRADTGQDMTCLNFGIDSSTAASAAALAQILVEDYRPRLLIYGTNPRDYALPGEEIGPNFILESNWVRYRQGHFTIEGWLIEHSYLYRYRPHLYNLSRFHFENALRSNSTLDSEMTPDGMTPLSTVATYINDPPDPQDDSFSTRHYRRVYSSYKMLEENLVGLEQIMSHNRQETQVIIVEMPVSKGLFYFFGNGKKDHQHFIAQISRLAEAYQVPFWQTTSLQMIPDDGWADYSHLNTKGAYIFSSWLGQQVGEVVGQGMVSTTAP
jgi:hypothetical protein